MDKRIVKCAKRFEKILRKLADQTIADDISIAIRIASQEGKLFENAWNEIVPKTLNEKDTPSVDILSTVYYDTQCWFNISPILDRKNMKFTVEVKPEIIIKDMVSPRNKEEKSAIETWLSSKVNPRLQNKISKKIQEVVTKRVLFLLQDKEKTIDNQPSTSIVPIMVELQVGY